MISPVPNSPAPTEGSRRDSLSDIMGDPPLYESGSTAAQAQNHLTCSPAPNSPAHTGYWRHDSLSGILGEELEQESRRTGEQVENNFTCSPAPHSPVLNRQEGWRWNWEGDHWWFGPQGETEEGFWFKVRSARAGVPAGLVPSREYLSEANFNPAELRDWRGRWTTDGGGPQPTPSAGLAPPSAAEPWAGQAGTVGGGLSPVPLLRAAGRVLHLAAGAPALMALAAAEPPGQAVATDRGGAAKRTDPKQPFNKLADSLAAKGLTLPGRPVLTFLGTAMNGVGHHLMRAVLKGLGEEPPPRPERKKEAVERWDREWGRDVA